MAFRLQFFMGCFNLLSIVVSVVFNCCRPLFHKRQNSKYDKQTNKYQFNCINFVLLLCDDGDVMWHFLSVVILVAALTA